MTSETQALRGTQQSFIFLPHDKVAEASDHLVRRQINRHVQLARPAKQLSNPTSAARQQIRFRLRSIPRRRIASSATSGHHANHVGNGSAREYSDQHAPLSRALNDHCGTFEDRSTTPYFAHVVATELCDEFTSHFWQVLVLQQAHRHPLIQHAIAALSSVHRHIHQLDVLETGGMREVSSTPFIALAVLRVIVELRAYMDSPDPDQSTIITCASLLCQIHEFTGEDEIAALHLDKIFAMFNSWAQSSGAFDSADFEAIRTMLVRSDIAASLQDPYRLPMVPSMPPPDTESLTFSSIEEMDDHITKYAAHRLFELLPQKNHNEAITPSRVRELLSIEKYLSCWSQAANSFRKSSTFSLNEKLGLLMVEAHYLATISALGEVLQRDVSLPARSYDFYLDNMLDIGAKAVEIQRALHAPAVKVAPIDSRGRNGKGIGEILLLFADKVSQQDGRASALRLVEEYSSFMTIRLLR